MGLFSRLAGTIATFFQIGGPAGPGLNANGAALEARDSANSTFAVMRGAAPVGANDFVIKSVAIAGVGSSSFITSSGGTSPSIGVADPSTGLIPYPTMPTHKVTYFIGVVGAGGTFTAGMQYWGFDIFASSAASTVQVVLATTNKLTATRRVQFNTAAASQQLGINENGRSAAWRGNAAGLGGFMFRARFAFTSVSATPTILAMIGLADTPSGFTNWVTDTTIGKLGLAYTATLVGGALSGNWKIVEGTQAAITVHDLGANFAVTLNHLIELIMYAAPNDNKVSYIVNDLTNGNTTNGVLNTTLPTNFLSPLARMNISAGGAATNAIDISHMYLECFDG